MEISNEVDDPRQPRNGTRQYFQELLVMTISAVLSDCDTIEDVEALSRANETWFGRFLVMRTGFHREIRFCASCYA